MSETDLDKLRPGDFIIRTTDNIIYQVAEESELPSSNRVSMADGHMLFRYVTYYPANIDYKQFASLPREYLLTDNFSVMHY